MSLPISGFTAVPNPIMLSFMGAQSFIMMYMAGEAWQYGKRKISAMTNEEFNKLTPIELLKQQQSTLKEAIPSMEKSMKDMQPMIKTIAAEMLAAIPQITAGIGQGISNIINPAETGGTTISPGLGQAGLLGGASPGVIQPGLDFWQNFWNALVGAVKGAGTTGIVTSVLTESDIEHKPPPSAKTEAEIKQDRDDAIEKFGSTVIEDQHSILEQEHKPFAGQTQRLARDDLIAKIALMAKNVKLQSQAEDTRLYDNYVMQLKAFQTKLTQLLNRYRW